MLEKLSIFLGADHRGFKLKEQLKTWLKAESYQVVDCGNTVYDPDDDFPDFAFAVAEQVADHTTPDKTVKGIIICGSGVGVNIAANKVNGIRASTAVNLDEVKHARQHDDLNVLAISADYTSFQEAQEMIEIFLTTPFEAEERFLRRLRKIKNYGAAV